MAKVTSKGKDKIQLQTINYVEVIRVDEDKKDFLKRNGSRIQFDSFRNTWRYISKKGQHTTLAKRLYSSYKACKPLDTISKRIHFKNNDRNDMRLENLTTRT
jgi:hypothetical protein